VGWLVGYILINLSVTFLNKGIFVNYGWPYPTTLALWHYTCTSVGSIVYVRVLKQVPAAKLEWTAIYKLMVFSLLFNVNIWISNFSLNLVSMTMHQMVRALVPACTVVISFFLLQKQYSKGVLSSLVVIFFGVCIYSYKGELDYTMFGLCVTALGAVLAALKGVITNMFMVGSLKLHPIDLLTYTTTFSAIQLYLALTFFSDEFDKSLVLSSEKDHDLIQALMVNGVGAFALNIVSFSANKKTSPLAMNIGGVTKQVLAIVVGIILFKTPVTTYSVMGVAVTVGGILLYARQSYVDKKASSVPSSPARPTMLPK